MAPLRIAPPLGGVSAGACDWQKWHSHGGKVHVGETKEAATCRETLERALRELHRVCIMSGRVSAMACHPACEHVLVDRVD